MVDKMLMILLLITMVTCGDPIRQFVRALEREDTVRAQQLLHTMERELTHQHKLRLSLPTGQQLRWQLKREPQSLGRLRTLCLTYQNEVQRIIRGFLHREPNVEAFFTSKLVALYHLRLVVKRDLLLSGAQKELLMTEIAQVGTRDGPHVEALRQRLSPIYERAKV